MKTKPTQREIDPDTETIEVLDTLGYLRNGSSIWTLVSKDFDLDAEPTFSGLHFECCKEGESPFEVVSGLVIQRLVNESYIKPLTRPDGNNANNKILFFQLEPKGEQWYLQEYARWETRLHHKLA